MDALGQIKRFEALKAERGQWDSLWQEVSDLVLPAKSTFVAQKSKGDKRTLKQRDSTAVHANQLLASSLHTTLTSPAIRWFELKFRDDEANKLDAAKEWLEECADRISNELNESNFNSEVNELYLDIGCFGTGVLSVEEKVKTADAEGWAGFNFRSLHLSEICIAENSDGMVDTVYREFRLTARQAYQQWGEDAGDKVMKALERTPDKTFRFLHCVHPREDYGKKGKTTKRGEPSPPNQRPIASVWISVADKKIIKDDGYYEMPVMVPRWSKLSGDTYGFSPALIARPDIKMLNEAKLFSMRAWEKAIDPPVIAQHQGIIGDLRMNPGGLSMVRDINGVKTFDSGSRFDVSQIKEEELRRSIRTIFFSDQLQLQESPTMTATEVQIRYELMQRLLGATLGRLQSEFLNPLVIRCFYMMFRAGVLPEPPQELGSVNAEIDIEYVGALARAQRMEDVDAIQRWVESLMGVAQISPDVLNIVDFEGAARIIADRLGVPASAINSEEVMQQMAQEQAQAAQAQAEMAQMQQGMEVANQGAELMSKLPADQVPPEILNG